MTDVSKRAAISSSVVYFPEARTNLDVLTGSEGVRESREAVKEWKAPISEGLSEPRALDEVLVFINFH